MFLLVGKFCVPLHLNFRGHISIRTQDSIFAIHNITYLITNASITPKDLLIKTSRTAIKRDKCKLSIFQSGNMQRQIQIFLWIWYAWNMQHISVVPYFKLRILTWNYVKSVPRLTKIRMNEHMFALRNIIIFEHRMKRGFKIQLFMNCCSLC